MEETTTPGVEELATQTEADAPSTTGTEAVTKTEDENKQFVPLERFQEVNNDLKQTKAEMAAINEKLTALGTPKVEESGFDSDTEAQLERFIKSKGYVSQTDLDNERLRIQADSDLKDLKTKYKLSDADFARVREEAGNMGVKNARGLEAAYSYLFQDRIIDEKVKAAIAGGTATAEKPGGTSETTPPADQTQKPGMTMTERVRAAMNK